ncbi:MULTISPECIES: GNAT family N-acetyltransferase [Deefgea]|uniref:GNAT family N-acetyltransferase n=1 Tax=Deefgea chitinilytica TaxID=570276 RepID=A0ABS2CG80_9NEIS|nr:MULTISPECIES: GNAT family N-acetyltransferase [Deefgea]MBM5572438.1 GNAT family N-acetyltransferase [Deefgea chitinilytica]MBM9889674.1 GNAT family N-acetyltransferase [Deefgea sp. CFH1-16]
MSLTWRWYTFSEFDTSTLFQYLRLRQQVFVVEQNCAYPDIDDLDVVSTHLLGWLDGQIVACLRLVPPSLKYAEPSLGRVIAVPAMRGTGLGYQLIDQGLQGSAAQYPGMANRIGAQSHLQRFYARHGFVTVSDEYDEDGILHVDMLRSA